MSDTDEISAPPTWAGGQAASGSASRIASPSVVTFHRRELDVILRLYGRMVADGEWRDYAIDHMKDRAVFSVFRRASEMPLYRIEKNPKFTRRQGAYSVVAAGGVVLKRGHDLTQVIKVLEKKRHLRVVGG
ncbi:DUF2794 domain-containing protein [Roseibium aquae]|uniref:DUF2794 domain-containing protein n=1 Tax=Roseibium aquae TaxID=1323746 RepID=UPI00123C869F|nr:DUF2794 domain-containing protein [Roseibium aquae]